MEINKEKSVGLLKRLFCFSGRATRKDFWLTALGLLIADIVVIGVCSVLANILEFLSALFVAVMLLLVLAIAVASVANMFRRIHDLGLSGFWTCYLSPFGLPFLFCAYIMDADESAKEIVERIKNLGSPWLGWIVATLFWPTAATFGMLLILLSPGQKKDNLYGPNPYVVAALPEPAAEATAPADAAGPAEAAQ